jgi:protein SCO1/2
VTQLSTRRKLLLTAVSLLAVVAVVWVVMGPGVRPHVFHGSVIQSLTRAPEIDLESTQGGVMGIDDFTGKLAVVYFGYTHCPDVCPATLATLDRALDQMGSDAHDDVQVVMVSVDPERDTVEYLREYMEYFDESFIGLTGDPIDVARVATTYGVYFAAAEGTAETGYTVDHTASLMVIDRDGHLRLVFPPELTADEIASDLEYLR